jgi:hypothetical protein
MKSRSASRIRQPTAAFPRIRLLVAAALVVLPVAAPAAADDPDSAACQTAPDGVLVCPEMEVEGQLRQPPQVVVGRESLDSRIADLRASFLPEIESSVLGDPF